MVAAFLFIQHGTKKMFGFPAPQRAELELFSLMGVGDLLILIGLFTRPVGFLLSGEMAFAYFIAHTPQNFWPLLNGGELAVLWCFLFLFFSAAGAGPWSLDHYLAKKRRTINR